MLVTVDTGGTKTLVWVFNEQGEPISKLRFPTPQDSAEYIETLRAELKSIGKEYSIEAISIATPGVIKNNIIIWAGGNLTWEKIDLPLALADIAPGAPIFVENDAKVGGLGEVRMLDPQPDTCLYVTISTGIGTGLVYKGKIDPGMRFSEGGHALIEYDGALQEWEKFASGQAVYKAFGKYGKDIEDERTWQNIADRISRGFLALIPLIEPDVVIIGGSMGTYFSKYKQSLVGILKERLPEHILCPDFINAKHPEEAVIYGCYFNALDNLSVKETL